MKTTTSRISQAIDAIKLSLDDARENEHDHPLTPMETFSQLVQEIESLQAKKAALIAEIKELEARKIQLIKTTAKKNSAKPSTESSVKHRSDEHQEAFLKLKAAFDDL